MKSGQITSLVCLLFLFPACPALENGGANSARIKLATWNIEWLAGKPNSGKVKRTSRDYAKLREYASKLDADVIALQEIEGTAAAGKVFHKKLYEVECSARGDKQSVCIALKKGIAYRRNRDYRELGLAGNYLRWGVDVTLVRGKSQVRLLALHLKGGCYEGSLIRNKTCRKLKKQLAEMEEWIDSRARENLPFVVLGDFNRRLNAKDTFWKEIDDGEPPEADLVNPGEGKTSRCQQGKHPQYIDHLILSRQAARLMEPGSFRQLVFTPEDEGTFSLSDHCPVSVEINFNRSQ